jgi:hypothetical protein
MASWREAAEPHLKSGRLVLLGAVQEQHPDRARLYRQWKRIDWPIVIDALNTLGLEVVPVPRGLDENGIVRLAGPITPESVRSFVEAAPPAVPLPEGFNRAVAPDAASAAGPFERGTALFLKGGDPDEIVKAFEEAAERSPGHPPSHFRLGVALRARADSPARRPDDAQRAVDSWGAALDLQPNQYIWRRRIQQFGPRLDKPYDFFFWVEEARREISARGETPTPLVLEPAGSEIAPPARKGDGATADPVPNPDPKGRIVRDDRGRVSAETTVTPSRVRPGERIRVRTTFRLHPLGKSHWNNEGDPLTLSIELPPDVSLKEGGFTFRPPPKAVSDEVRVLEWEATIAPGAAARRIEVPGYAVYGLCDDGDGTCRHLRLDLKATFQVDPGAARLQQ